MQKLIVAAGAYSIDYNTDMLQKNLNADMTNPNVYHSIDDNFEDHVYDEIKAKDNPGKLKFSMGAVEIWRIIIYVCFALQMNTIIWTIRDQEVHLNRIIIE